MSALLYEQDFEQLVFQEEQIVKSQYFDAYFNPVTVTSNTIYGEQRRTATVEWSDAIGKKKKGAALIKMYHDPRIFSTPGWEAFQFYDFFSLLTATLTFSFKFTDLNVPKEDRKNPLFTVLDPIEFWWNCADNTLEIIMTKPVRYTLYKQPAQVDTWYTVDFQIEPSTKKLDKIYLNGSLLAWPTGYTSISYGYPVILACRFSMDNIYAQQWTSAIQFAIDDIELRSGFYVSPTPIAVAIPSVLWIVAIAGAIVGGIVIYKASKKPKGVK